LALSETQNVLARLYTDAEFRERFLRAPGATGARAGLPPAEAEQLAGEGDRLRLYARSLQHKRAGEVGRLLPLTRRLLGTSFRGLFLEYADTFVPNGLGKHREDALRFARFLAGCALPARAIDLARYEATGLELSAPGRCVRVRLFRYPVGGLGRALDQGEDTAPRRGWALGLWVRLRPNGALRHWILETKN
jgi:hypothetical protein